MKVNLTKNVICNGAITKRLLMKVWKAGRLPPPRITARDLISARKALGKGSSSRRSRPTGLMAPRDAQKKVWATALDKGRGRGPIRHLRKPADRLGWIPQPGRCSRDDQFFTWYEADYRVKWDSARVLCADVATERPDFVGLETGLSAQRFRHLKKAATRVDERSRSAVNASLGGVWRKRRWWTSPHIMFRCPHWHEERRQVELPPDENNVPACVKLHGLLPALRVPPAIHQEPVLAIALAAL
eukprot:3913504-Amphidinium_carterae.1